MAPIPKQDQDAQKGRQQGRSERRGEEVPTALCVAVRPYNDSWRTENTLQCFRASERHENAAGGIFQHPARGMDKAIDPM